MRALADLVETGPGGRRRRAVASHRLAAHAVVLMDRAGWHGTDKLDIPKNLTIILLPPRSPELNPVEKVCAR